MTIPTTARDLVVALVEGGLSRKQIGKSLGVNDSYIGRVFRGERGATAGKYAARLEQLTGELEARQAAGVPVRRGEVITTTAPVDKRRQNVRRPARIYESSRATTARAKRQATRSGARSLVGEIRYAASTGRHVAVDLQVTSSLYHRVSGSGSKAGNTPPAVKTSASYTVTIGGVSALEWLEVLDEVEGNLVAAALRILVDQGRLEDDDDGESLTDVVGVEVRTWA